MLALTSQLGLRARLLIAPALVLVLMTALGLVGRHGLQEAAETARQSAAETSAVEILRDSNSRQFEGHRFQSLALGAATRKEFDEMVDEDADVMGESIEGFEQFAKVARTPALREEALGMAALVAKIERRRKQVFARVTPGQ